MSDIKDATSGLWTSIYEDMDPTEILWVFAPNLYTGSDSASISMEMADDIRSSKPFLLRNIITVHRHYDGSSALRPSYEEILFLVKDKDEYVFNKDDIRVENVYEGNEWNGLREEGQSSYRGEATKRYNPEGKDPGNVWLSEHRNESAGQVVDSTTPVLEARKRAANRCVRAAGDQDDTVKTVWASEEVISAAEEEERKVEELLVDGESVDDLE